MSELLITENDFAPLRDGSVVPEVLNIEGCDLVAHGPPRDLAGLVELNIEGGNVDGPALQRWLAVCPDLSSLDVEGAALGELSWRVLPSRLQQLSLRLGELTAMVDPPATSGLKVIELTSCGLQSVELSPSLSGLERISLAYNPDLRACPDLPWSAKPFSVDLRGCGLKAWPTVSGVEKVSVLDLSFNPVGRVPQEVQSWSSLSVLRMADCAVTEIDEVIGTVPYLRELWLKDNALAQLPDGLGELSSLRVLDLSRCQLAELPECVGKLHALETLLLSENPLPKLPESILGLKSLRNLQLWKTGLTSMPASLSGLDNLRQLELSYNPLERLPDLRELPALGYLGLCGLRALDWRQGFDCLANLQCVGNVSFTNNDFETFDDRVFKIHGLQRIDVNKTGVDGAEWQGYREEFPDVTIWGG